MRLLHWAARNGSLQRWPGFALALAGLSACGGGGSPGPTPDSTPTVVAGLPFSSLPRSSIPRLQSPLTMDAQGNLYGLDRNCNLHRMTPDGAFTQVASLTPGGDCDLGGGKFIGVQGLAVDTAGNFYIGDSANAVVRKLSANGVLSVLAGMEGATGFSDGTGTAARFSFPCEVAVDAGGTVYVNDGINSAVRRISPQGEVTTLPAGTLAGEPSSPQGLALDASGSVYTADLLTQRVFRIAPDGTPHVLAGSAKPRLPGESRDGAGDQAVFADIQALSVDATGTVYVADGSTLRKISPAGVVSTLAGKAGIFDSLDGPGDTARFYRPTGLAADPRTGRLVVRDLVLGLRTVSVDGQVATLGGRGSIGSTDGPGALARFLAPAGVAVDARGAVYVADSGNGTVRKVAPDGTVSTFAGLARLSPSDADGIGPAAEFLFPTNMTFDAAGRLLVVDLNLAIRRVTPEAVVSKFVKLYDVGELEPSGCRSSATLISDIASDAAGTVYFTDPHQHIVCRITAQGEFSLVAGSAGQPGSEDGEGAAARFLQPRHLAIDATGTLYVSDTGNHTLRKINPQGVVSTLAGSTGQAGATDGTGTQARFAFPGDLVIALDGSLYIADIGNSGIRKVAPDGTVSTFIHAPSSGLSSGMRTATLANPVALALGPGDQLYIADDGQNALLRASLP